MHFEMLLLLPMLPMLPMSLPLSSSLPFDAHNHIHMGPTLSRKGICSAGIDTERGIAIGSCNSEYYENGANLLKYLSGMAVMSTHPRDFPKVLQLALESENKIIPCIGVHPWFLHDLLDEDWKPARLESMNSTKSYPRWIATMEELLMEHPNMPVGEIGLDGFHFDSVTKDLTTPMERQIQALELQLELATRHQRPVSLHCVRAIGPLMNTISKVQKSSHGKLPPALYFHAFGGKAATVSQLVKTLEKQKATSLFFGFAPVINFDSHKTVQVIQEVGLDRLVLETDHEDAALVASSMELGLQVISKALEVSEDFLIQQTNHNVCRLYGR